jgi:hypothetical protein
MSNIDALLERLSEGNVAHELVSLLRAEPPAGWQEKLKSFLERRVAQEIQAYRHAADNTPGD